MLNANSEKERLSFKKLILNKNQKKDQLNKLRDLLKKRGNNEDNTCKKRVFRILKDFLKDKQDEERR